jgi:outer membrane protein
MNPLDFILWYSFMLAAFLLGGNGAHANDLKQLYELALTRDTVLQVAHFQRDANVEVRPQALASLLPQISASASAATRSRPAGAASSSARERSSTC